MSVVTFLEAKMPLVKIIRGGSKNTSYPNAKMFKSYTVEYSPTNAGLQKKFEAIVDAARNGCCQFRGQLTEQLEDWAVRRGKTDKDGANNSVVFDLDGIKLPGVMVKSKGNKQQDVINAAEAFISHLPEPFQDASYIASASSSYGIKDQKVSMHIEFELTTALNPRLIKQWLMHLNMTNPYFKDRVSLTNSKTAISYPVDISLGDNSRLIYIAPPTFEGMDNPFDDDAERYVLVRKLEPTVSLSDQMDGITPDSLERLKVKMTNALRKKAGLAPFKPKYVTLTAMGETHKVINNPDSMNMELVSVDGGFARWNINGGDSQAYYCFLHSPNIVHNFKGEPPFEFSKADPEAYSRFMEDYGDAIGAANPVMPHVFVDYGTAKMFKCVYNMDTNTFDKLPAEVKDTKTQVDDWYAKFGKTRPEHIPTWDMVFDPQSPHVLDIPNERVNTYNMPELLRNPAPILPFVRGAKYGEGKKLEQVAPNTYKLIHHMLGCDDTTYEHFINWFAFCVQERRVSKTCWIITGTQGTGKGQFYDRVVLPIFGEPYTSKAWMDQLEDTFNGEQSNLLFGVIDEFNINKSKKGEALENKLKNLISEERGRIRAMRTDGQNNIKKFCNWMLFSNDVDAMVIPTDDRRYNVSPPQNVKFGVAHPHMHHRLEQYIDPEIGRVASFLLAFDVNQGLAQDVLDNKARRDMMAASRTWVEDFFAAFMEGEIGFFLELLDPNFGLSGGDVAAKMQAQAVVKRWAADASAPQSSFILPQDLNVVYNARAEKPMTFDKFRSMLKKYKMPETVRKKIGNTPRKRYYEIIWDLTDPDVNAELQHVLGNSAAPSNSKTPANVSNTPPTVQ